MAISTPWPSFAIERRKKSFPGPNELNGIVTCVSGQMSLSPLLSCSNKTNKRLLMTPIDPGQRHIVGRSGHNPMLCTIAFSRSQ